MEKYIEGVKACKASVAWIVPLRDTENIIKAVKAACPGVTHQITIDWDDDSLYWLRFTRVSNSELNPEASKTVQKAPSATGTVQTPENKKQPDPPRARYGGPRW